MRYVISLAAAIGLAVGTFTYAAAATEQAPVPIMGGPGAAPGSVEAAPVPIMGGPGGVGSEPRTPSVPVAGPVPPAVVNPEPGCVFPDRVCGPVLPPAPPFNPCFPVNTSPRVCGP